MRVIALVKRIIMQFVHDKRSLALMFVAPMLILWLMSMVFNGAEYKPTIAAVDVPGVVTQRLADQGATIRAESSDAAENDLQHDKVDAVLRHDGMKLHVTLEGSDPSVSRSVLIVLQKSAQDVPQVNQPLKPEISYLHGSATMSAFDNFGPVLIGYFAFFFVFILSGVAFLRERTGGTMERLLSTPLRRWEIVAGYLIGYGIFTMLQAVLIAWFAVDVVHMMMVGSFGYVLLITLLMAMSALTLGTLLSAYANSEFQMLQFIPLVVVPQIFFSGLFNIATMAPWLRGLSVVMPMTYGAEAMRNIMIRGGGWADIAKDVYVLAGFSVVCLIANVVALRRYRKI